MENRSLDNLLGGQKTAGIENPINNGPFCNPYSLSAPSQGSACTAASDYNSVLNDPDHAVYGNNLEFYGTFTPNNAAIANGTLVATQKGFVQEQLRLYSGTVNRTVLATQVMNYYTEAQVPVLTALVKNFVTFNHWHSDVPGPTNPNRAALTSGTSYGHGSNDAAFGSYGLPQRSIFQQLTETGHSWRNYVDPKGGTGPDAGFYNWTKTSGNTGLIKPLANFYTDAAAGTLPELSYLNPSCCGVGTNSMHPSGRISDGEALIKKVYESLRSSPQWNHTLFILTFDESGGFHDHVPPPLAPAPDSKTYTVSTPDAKSYTLPFNRLGGRIPTLLISRYVAKAKVEQKGTNASGATVSYSASSILRTLGLLWGFTPFNPRVSAAPSFHGLILATARTDAPVTLPASTPFRA
ncbi:Phosphoesterase [Rhypophila decipiens]